MNFLDCYYQNVTNQFTKKGLVDYVGQVTAPI